MRLVTSTRKILTGTLLIWLCHCFSPVASAKTIHHYVFFNRKRERIAERSFLETSSFEGAQLKYTWRELEPEPDRYDFSSIRHDLEFLTSRGKKLFIQLQDVSFDESIVNVPRYLLGDARYGGGAVRDYQIEGDDEAQATPGGWVARRWDPAVQERFHKLLMALGREFDGRIEGINLPETSVSFGESGRLFPKGFTFERYREAVLTNMQVLKRAFTKSVAMQYANFMPGDWLRGIDRSYLREVYQRAKELKVAVGGPDLLPYRPWQMNHSYGLIREFGGAAPTGIAVQWGNYEQKNPKTGRRVTIPELVEFATEYLRVDYIFWETQEPFYTGQLIPFLARGQTGERPRFEEMVREFDYDEKAPLDVREVGRERRDGVTIIDLTYASPRGGRVPAYMVVPKGKGPFPAVLFGHWMMPGSPLKNRREFLDEAVVLARAGAVSLLIDAPLVRPGVVEEKDLIPSAVQGSEASRQQVVDFRRGIDLLLTNPGISKDRIAYVGHSFDAHVGGILSAVEKRIQSFVLMAGGFATEEYVFDPDNVEMHKLREKAGDEAIREYFRKYAWDDPINLIGHSAPAAVYLQFGSEDKPITEKMARRYFELFAQPKQISFYSAGHALNAEARRDRAEWLRQRLSLKAIDHAALARIPELK